MSINLAKYTDGDMHDVLAYLQTLALRVRECVLAMGSFVLLGADRAVAGSVRAAEADS